MNGPSNQGPSLLGLSSLDREGFQKGNSVLSRFKDTGDGFSEDVSGSGVVSPPRQAFSSPISLQLSTDEALLEKMVSYPS